MGGAPGAAGGQGSSTPWATKRSEAQHRPCLPSQEIGNKKQKKAALSEEDDSGVEVYYREGEEEVEEMSVLPKVRGGGAGEEAAPGGRSLVSCLRTGLSSAPLSCPHFL